MLFLLAVWTWDHAAVLNTRTATNRALCVLVGVCVLVLACTGITVEMWVGSCCSVFVAAPSRIFTLHAARCYLPIRLFIEWVEPNRGAGLNIFRILHKHGGVVRCGFQFLEIYVLYAAVHGIVFICIQYPLFLVQTYPHYIGRSLGSPCLIPSQQCST